MELILLIVTFFVAFTLGKDKNREKGKAFLVRLVDYSMPKKGFHYRLFEYGVQKVYNILKV